MQEVCVLQPVAHPRLYGKRGHFEYGNGLRRAERVQLSERLGTFLVTGSACVLTLTAFSSASS
uniref:Uncharacterized protein n=1 Tax=Anguilla anguilla TaxID=7936 RepID=A0A0E9T9J2_ANGAN